MQKRLTRSEAPLEQTWDLSDLFPSDHAWDAEFTALSDGLGNVTRFEGRLSEGTDALLECLKAQEAFQQRLTRVMAYASLRNSEDGSNPENQARADRVNALGAKVGAAFSFIRAEVLQLKEGLVKQYLQQEPELQAFRRYLEDLQDTKPYTLSPDVEKALASLSQVLHAPYTTYTRAKSSDMEFPPLTGADGEELPMSFALYENQYELMSDTNLRRQAYQSFVRGLTAYKHTFASTLSTEVKRSTILSRIRGYESATHMLLHPQQVPIGVYHNVLDIIQSELAPHMRRYANLRKRVLGLDRVLHCDLKVSLDPEFQPEITRQQATDLILESLQILGAEYMGLMRRAVRDRWIDWVDNVGKATGAFCSSPYGVHSFILMTWTNTMRGAFVLAHELGHAGHFCLAMRYQRLPNLRPSALFVEAPSTMNEMLLADHILSQTTDPRMRRWVIMQLLNTYHHNFIIHLLEGELQRRLYRIAGEGTPITALTLSREKGEILGNFWGSSVDLDEGARLTWMRQPHYYMGLYPYTYAAGLTTSTAVAQDIREQGRPAAERWVEALKSGGTMRPFQLAKAVGVDMSSPEPIKKAVAYVGSLIDELERSF